MNWFTFAFGVAAGIWLCLVLSAVGETWRIRHAGTRKNDEAAIRIVFPSQEAMISWLADNIRAMEHKEEA